MVFSPVVSCVGEAWPPKVPELPLCIPALQPVEPHVHGFCGLWGDTVGEDAVCGGVVSLHGRSLSLVMVKKAE